MGFKYFEKVNLTQNIKRPVYLNSMIIYKNELNDGLEPLLKNTSVAYTSSIEPSLNVFEKPKEFDIPAKASQDNFDLFPFNSILVSVGWNKNDDVFLPEEVWKARNTPIFKKVNYEHDEKDVIGVITASTVCVNSEPYNEEEIPTAFDIAVSSVLYRNWEDDVLQDRMNNIINEIAEDKWFVSMECLFSNFDYALSKGDSNQIIQRNQQTSFLTKHLRWYGGTGTWNGYSIGRVLKDFVFSGKGLVKQPANDKSIILTKAFHKPKITEYIMEKEQLLQIELEKERSEKHKAQATVEKLTEELAAKVEAAQKLEKDKLEKDLHKKELVIADLQKELDTVKAELNSKVALLEESDSALSTTKATLVEVQARVAKAEEEKMLTDRMSALIKHGVDEAKAKEIVTKWKNTTAEQFADVVALYTPLDNTDVESEVDLTKASVEVTIDTPAPTEEPKLEDQLQASLASWIKQSIQTPIKTK